jgi:hypothetical protein
MEIMKLNSQQESYQSYYWYTIVKPQPVGRLVSYDEIKHIVQLDPRQTREGRAIMRRALKDLLKDGFVFLVKRGYGIYLAKGIHYRISKKEDL